MYASRDIKQQINQSFCIQRSGELLCKWGQPETKKRCLPVEALPVRGELGIHGAPRIHRQHTEPTGSATTLPPPRKILAEQERTIVQEEVTGSSKVEGRSNICREIASSRNVGLVRIARAEAGPETGSANTTAEGSSVGLFKKQRGGSEVIEGLRSQSLDALSRSAGG